MESLGQLSLYGWATLFKTQSGGKTVIIRLDPGELALGLHHAFETLDRKFTLLFHYQKHEFYCWKNME